MTEAEHSAALSLMTRHLPQILHHLDQLGRALRTTRRASEAAGGRFALDSLPEVAAYKATAHVMRTAIVGQIGRIGAIIGEEWGFEENEK